MSTASETDSTENQPESKIRIVYHNTSPKLSKRGKGLLEYELGVKDTTGEYFTRIAGNPGGGSCSYEWVDLKTIEDLLQNRSEEDYTFKASIFIKVFVGRSSTNSGFLAAILREEGVIYNNPEQPSTLLLSSFEQIKAKITSLMKEGIDLPDKVAVKKQERDDQKEQRRAERVKTQLEEAEPITDTEESSQVKPNPLPDQKSSNTKLKKKTKSTNISKKKKVTKQPDTKSGQ